MKKSLLIILIIFQVLLSGGLYYDIEGDSLLLCEDSEELELQVFNGQLKDMNIYYNYYITSLSRLMYRLELMDKKVDVELFDSLMIKQFQSLLVYED